MELIALAVLIVLVGGLLYWAQTMSNDKLLVQIRDAYRLGDGEEGDALLEKARPKFASTRARLRLIDTLYGSRAWPQAMQIVTDGLDAAPDHRELKRFRARLAWV